MNSTSLTIQYLPTFMRFSGITTRDRPIFRIMMWLLAMDMIIVPLVFIKLFHSTYTTSFHRSISVAMNNENKIGSATSQFIKRLSNSDMVPRAVKNITHKTLTVKGNLITLGNDNIQIFEYGDASSAQLEAAALSKRYMSSSRSLAWKKDMHIYVDSTLVIFYMGNRENVLDSLNHIVDARSTDLVRVMISP